jgi:hypothetical protein|tara:strand:- start:381 stop:605 length:225 start_codon:yes stop_codon:yes gene_type:complete
MKTTINRRSNNSGRFIYIGRLSKNVFLYVRSWSSWLNKISPSIINMEKPIKNIVGKFVPSVQTYIATTRVRVEI